MKYILGMTTIDRQDFGVPSTLPKTMASLSKSGFWDQGGDHPFVLFDGGSKSFDFLNPFRDVAEISGAGEKVDIRDSHRLLMEYVLSKYTADFLILMQDDILFCRNWFTNLDLWLKRFYQSDVWCYSFYTPYREAANTKNRVWKYPANKYYGNLCLAIDYKHLDKLAKKIRENPFKGGSDMNIKYWLLESNQEYLLASCPSIAQHQKSGSTLGHKHSQCQSFMGEDVDPRIYESR